MKVQGFIVLLLAVAGVALISFISIFSHGLSQGGQQRQEEQRSTPVLTIENAPNSLIKGSIRRKLKSGWDGPSRVKRVVTLHPNDFDVVFAEAYGDDWVYRFQAGKGEWTTPSEKGEILSLSQDGTRAKWSGRLIDKSHGDDPIYFEMTFWVP